MFRMKASQSRAALPSLLRVAAPAAALLLGACVPPQSAPTSATDTPDPALQGHSQWCNTNPPSGYCGVDDRR